MPSPSSLADEGQPAVGPALDADPHLVAGVGVLHRVVDEVGHGAGDLARVAQDDSLVEVADEVERDAGALGDGGHRRERLLDDRDQVDLLHGGRVLRVAHLRQHRQPLEQVAQPLAGPQDGLGTPLVALVDGLARGQELGVGGDDRHRVVDLVGQLAQEPVPRHLELAQLLEQAALALGGVRVGDGASEVVAELERGDALAVGPAARPGAPRAHQHAEHLVVDARRERRRRPRSRPCRARSVNQSAYAASSGSPQTCPGSMMSTRWWVHARAAASSRARRTSGAISRPRLSGVLGVLVDEDPDLQLVDRQRRRAGSSGPRAGGG